MERLVRHYLENWTVDYGKGPEPVIVPHAWRQDMPVDWEGPAVYRSEVEVPRRPTLLRFHGVSYQAEVLLDGKLVTLHRGIWDGFDVLLDDFAGRRVAVEVRVIKNGGPTFPVQQVASGFLPFVFHTFGGLFGEVELVDRATDLQEKVEPSIVEVVSSRIYVEGKPFYMRGLLHWGWYPDLGHTNPPEETIRAEVQAAKKLGFNTIKFCLWVPPHRYLRILEEEGMYGWLELPLWDPSGDAAHLKSISEELEMIVRQYRHHRNLICWTVGCELSDATSAPYREQLVQMVRNLTGCPLVKDNSGGAEMYGGDPREFGTFDDFHPYCETPFYPEVLDSLLPGPRPRRPILLGEFNDVDVHRDLSRIGDELPFWASSLSELNAQGVRWQHDLPNLLPENRFSNEPRKNGHRALMESSRQKALFIRKHVQESVRARDAISGYVITGWRDTPISSSGFFNDWGDFRFAPEEVRSWNSGDVLFRIPSRRPPWINGGNRPGWIDPYNFFAGQVHFRIGLHSESGCTSGIVWRLTSEDGEVVADGALPQVEVPPLGALEVGQIVIDLQEGNYILSVEFGSVETSWPINVFSPWNPDEFPDWGFEASARLAEGTGLAGVEKLIYTSLPSAFDRPGVVLLDDSATIPMPFWREAAYEFEGDAWGLAGRWERLLSISPDRVIDSSCLPPEHQVIINRIDTRTYVEHPIAVKIGETIVTTLRPQGGLGNQPLGVKRNPSGAEFLRRLLREMS